MELTPDSIIYLEWGPVAVNATLVFTWGVMALLVLASWLVTRRLSVEARISRGQSLLETAVSLIRDQLGEITRQDPKSYLPFIGSLYLLIATANFLSFIPGYHPPTGSLSTTAAFAACAFLAVPVYGIAHRGVKGFLKHYVEPSAIMLPFNIISEISRTIAMAVRLFGNMMSGTLLVAVLLSVVPLFFPVVMQALELLIGQVQAYIFAVLATVYIASAARARREGGKGKDEGEADQETIENKGEKNHG
jgi:F-type H+-transporting ATPase subunit a